ncbi:MAG: hypothetical protein GJ676_03890 [Rhodobacteraceae bacterium]|nr:hypothetical protein [Paracoccaceae bacterium]
MRFIAFVSFVTLVALVVFVAFVAFIAFIPGVFVLSRVRRGHPTKNFRGFGHGQFPQGVLVLSLVSVQSRN